LHWSNVFKRHKSARIPLSSYLDALRIYFLVQIMEERKIKRQCWQINCKEDGHNLGFYWDRLNSPEQALMQVGCFSTRYTVIGSRMDWKTNVPARQIGVSSKEMNVGN
jgi:hypothetical protein